jgi:5-methylcytosine-specific restriction protein A
MSRATGFSPHVRQVMAQRSTCSDETAIAAICEIRVECVGALAVTFHHRRPRGRGGSRRPDTNLASNGLAACTACHDWVELHRTAAKEKRWLLEQNQVPADEPVLLRGVWVLLNDDGSITPADGLGMGA